MMSLFRKTRHDFVTSSTIWNKTAADNNMQKIVVDPDDLKEFDCVTTLMSELDIAQPIVDTRFIEASDEASPL